MSHKITRRTTYEPSEDIYLMLEEYRKKAHTEGFKDTLEALLRDQKVEIEGSSQLVKDLEDQLKTKALTDLNITVPPTGPSQESTIPEARPSPFLLPRQEEFYCSHTKQHLKYPKTKEDLLALPCLFNADLHCNDEVCSLIVQRFMRKFG